MSDSFILIFFQTLLLYPVELGAFTQLWGGTAPETADMNGKVRNSNYQLFLHLRPLTFTISEHAVAHTLGKSWCPQ